MYLVVRVDRVLDVPTMMEPMHVGRTLRPFRLRAREDIDPSSSHSAPLNSTLLMNDLSGIELWLCELALREARQTEKLPIRWLRPTPKEIKYKGESHG